MSQREFMIVLAHTHVCSACRARLLEHPAAALTGRPLTATERATLTALRFEDFLTPEALAHAAGIRAEELDGYRDEAVVRLRHL